MVKITDGILLVPMENRGLTGRSCKQGPGLMETLSSPAPEDGINSFFGQYEF
jgi:hypothetical protein